MKCLLALALAVACLQGITSLAVNSDDIKKPKLDELRSDKVAKGAVKTVVKRNAEVTNNTTTPGATSSPSTTQTPAQKLNDKLTEEDIKNLKKQLSEETPPLGNEYKNIIAVLSGGGLVSVAKAIQTLFVNMKKKKKKKGKKKDSESGSDSEEDDAPPRTVAVKIEMSNAMQTAGEAQGAAWKIVVPETNERS